MPPGCCSAVSCSGFHDRAAPDGRTDLRAIPEGTTDTLPKGRVLLDDLDLVRCQRPRLAQGRVGNANLAISWRRALYLTMVVSR